MAVELIADSAVPGTEPPIAILAAAVNASQTTITVTTAVAVAGLKGPGQFRIRIDAEIMLVTGGQTTTTWTVVRAPEGPAATTHAINAQVFHPLTLGALQNMAVSLAQLPASIVRADPKDLGAAKSGNVTLNLAEGHVFTLHTATPSVTILKPTNAIAGTPQYLELWAFGTFPISFFSELKWIGEAPTTDLTSGLNVYMLVTLDGTTWYGLAGGSIPADVVRMTGQTNGQVPVWNASTSKWVPTTPSAGGLSKEAVDAEIAAKAITLDVPLHLANEGESPFEGDALAIGPSGDLTYMGIQSNALEVAMRRLHFQMITVTTPTTIALGKLARVSGTVVAHLKLPIGTGFTPLEGELTGVINLSTEPAAVEGPFTIGAPATLTTKTILPNEAVFWMGGESVWIEAWSSRSRATVEALIAAAALPQDPDTAASGWIAQSFDQSAASGTFQLVNEVLYGVKVMMPFTKAVHEIAMTVITAGVGVTLGECAIFDSTGNLVVKVKVNEAAAFNEAKIAQMKLNATTTLTGGPSVFYYLAFLSVGGTPPFLARSGWTGRLRDLNAGIPGIGEIRAAKLRNAAKENTYTSIPSTLDLTSSLGKSSDVAPLLWAALD